MMIRSLIDRISDIQDEGEMRQAYTVMALFDDTIDAETSLIALRRSKQPPSEISVIFRERVLNRPEEPPHRTVLSVVVAKSALDVVGSWLQGLASLVLPDRATYLAAGPIGAILATLRDTRTHLDEHDPESSPLRGLPTRQLTRSFQAFGFERDEAAYVEQRVVAGSPLIAVTSENIETLRISHQILSRNTPVYIGFTPTEPTILAQATRLLTTGPRGTGAVVIADAVSPLRHIRVDTELQGTPRDLRGQVVTSRYGEVIGRVDDALYETEPDCPPLDLPHGDLSDESLVLRYIILRAGRRLGRRRIAIPGERVQISNNGIVVAVTHEELVSAPRFDSDAQLSRQEEATIRRYYGEPFYWIAE